MVKKSKKWYQNYEESLKILSADKYPINYAASQNFLAPANEKLALITGKYE